MSAIPHFADSQFLTAVVEALRKRGRAIKHQGVSLTTTRTVEVTDGEKCERLEIEARLRKRQQFKLFAWDDRALWMHAAEGSPAGSWNFQFTDGGRLMSAHTAADLVSALEASWEAMFEITAEDLDRLGSIWSPLLAKGPHSV